MADKKSLYFSHTLTSFLDFYLYINIILSFMELNLQFTPRPKINKCIYKICGILFYLPTDGSCP